MDNIKINGKWEDVETPYIKENGKWVESDDQYIKVGGHWSDTKSLSGTKLDYDMTIANDTDGSRYLVNKTATYGAEDANFDSIVQGIVGVGNTSSTVGTKTTYHQDGKTNDMLRPYCYYKVTDITKEYEATVTVTVTAGSLFIREMRKKDKTIPIQKEVTPSSPFTYTISGKVGPLDVFRIICNGEHSSNVYPSDYTIEWHGKEILTGTSITTHKAPLHSGHAVTLTGDGKVEVPINATLGSDGSSHAIKAKVGDLTSVDNGNGSYTITGITTNTSQFIEFIDTSMSTSNLVLTEFECVINSGGCEFRNYYDGSSMSPLPKGNFTLFTGTNKVENYNRPSRGCFLYFETGQTVDITITPTSIKEITAVQGSVTVYNETAKEFEQEDNLPISTTYSLKDSTIGVICKLHTGQFSMADIELLGKTPEKLISWYFGTAVLPSGIVKGTDDKVYYPMNGAYLELTYSEGANLLTSSVPSMAYTGDAVYTITANKNSFILDVTKAATKVTTFTHHNNEHSMLKNKLMKVSFTGKVTGDSCSVNKIYNGLAYKGIHKTIVDGKQTFYIHTVNDSTLNTRLHVTFRVGGVTKLEVSDYETHEVTSDYLTIDGTYTFSPTSLYGIQSLLTKGDIVPTGVAKANTIEGKADGRYVDLPLVDNTKKKHLITKCLKEIKGDITQVVDTPCTP